MARRRLFIGCEREIIGRIEAIEGANIGLANIKI